MEMQNLWPDFAIEKTKSPKAILKEQAGYLMEKTNNVLSAEIETSQSDGKIIHRFYIVAPAMDNYRYQIFTVTHGVIYYPVAVEWESPTSHWPIVEIEQTAQNEEEFIRILKEVFNNGETIRIISSLLSQSLAE
ncbi:hypothetical protein GCM10028806_00560 [Spirosoma terrae]|uniref:Uncharacterized protein n=1 Tax=Spirosoma terrae TaxID=1968276 RepID=A0A6L9LE97_9BACT|nr:hypothetical protein [Spirosoma terrae]NDU97682.1 hypothetical protein [Spirosoma terrae]